MSYLTTKLWCQHIYYMYEWFSCSCCCCVVFFLCPSLFVILLLIAHTLSLFCSQARKVYRSFIINRRHLEVGSARSFIPFLHIWVVIRTKKISAKNEAKVERTNERTSEYKERSIKMRWDKGKFSTLPSSRPRHYFLAKQICSQAKIFRMNQ